MSRSYVMLDLNDPRTGRLAEVMSNATCKKMLGLLAEAELSESEIATRLRAPLNTINYNMKKLVNAGLVEKTKSFWSSRGRAVKVYRVSQKKILLSPKPLVSGLVPALVVGALGSLALRFWATLNAPAGIADQAFAETAPKMAQVSSSSLANLTPTSWIWFLAGALIAIGTLTVWNKLKS